MPSVMMLSHDSHDSNGSNASQSPPPDASDSNPKKRASASAGVDSNGNPKPVKRRAAKACAACRARKVRCDVMQRYHITADGAVTCSNCTMDGIQCVIEESKRRKKHPQNSEPTNHATAATPPPQLNQRTSQNWGNGIVNPSDITNPDARRWSGSTMSNDVGEEFRTAHVSHPIYQNASNHLNRGDALRRQSFMQSPFDADPTYALLTSASIHGDRKATRMESPMPPAPPLKHVLPAYLKPLPQRMTSVDIDYLFAKGALCLPEPSVRNALLRSYIEYVHPYMPLVEIHELLQTINDGTGESGRISLLLFQAIMFAGTAFVDIEFLKAAGYSNRKAARKAYFQKARVLYDFDYEIDRVSLVQSLLLMTYWYETPDDQKDTWHWMGVAISLAHTIGLHRDPEKSNMEPNKKKLWKRIWWSCFMRDRLVALGMRRPTRVKDEDYDVPMLEEDDFEIAALSENNTIISKDCTLIRDVIAQRELAQMCIAKAKLCLCISHVLSAQYSVLVRHQGMQGQEGNTQSSVMLFPKKLDQTDEVQRCDVELSDWVAELTPACQYNNTETNASSNSLSPLFVQRALLHMVYFTTLSALHRPQVLPSAASSSVQPDQSHKLQDLSRKKVREASREITRISQDLHTRGLEKYLPTTGVTVLLPAIIIHLLDIKSCNDEARQAAMDGFCQCMLVLERLRDNYSSADFATQFLEAAIRKADIEVALVGARREKVAPTPAMARANTPPLSEEESGNMQFTSYTDDHNSNNNVGVAETHTPPPHNDNDIHIPIHDHTTNHSSSHNFLDTTFPDHMNINLDYSSLNLNDFLNFDTTHGNGGSGNGNHNGNGGGFMSGGNDLWNVHLDEGAHGESGVFVGDMNWVDHQMPSWSRLSSPLPEDGVGGGGGFIAMEVDS